MLAYGIFVVKRNCGSTRCSDSSPTLKSSKAGNWRQSFGDCSKRSTSSTISTAFRSFQKAVMLRVSHSASKALGGSSIAVRAHRQWLAASNGTAYKVQFPNPAPYDALVFTDSASFLTENFCRPAQASGSSWISKRDYKSTSSTRTCSHLS